MKALLLAAGIGSRLGKITRTTPKCLLEVNGEPMLEHWLTKLDKLGVNEFIINTHYLSDQVEKFTKIHKLKEKIKLSYEPNLLGTLGTLHAHSSNLRLDTSFIVHADNYCEDRLDGFLEAHQKRPKNTVLSMLTFQTKTPETCGIVKTDSKSRLVDFYEKIQEPPSSIANGAVYIATPNLFDVIDKLSIKNGDISKDLIPKLLKRIYCYHTDKYFQDIGSKTTFLQANDVSKQLNNQTTFSAG